MRLQMPGLALAVRKTHEPRRLIHRSRSKIMVVLPLNYGPTPTRVYPFGIAYGIDPSGHAYKKRPTYTTLLLHLENLFVLLDKTAARPFDRSPSTSDIVRTPSKGKTQRMGNYAQKSSSIAMWTS